MGSLPHSVTLDDPGEALDTTSRLDIDLVEKERLDFVANLDNYLALGCVSFEKPAPETWPSSFVGHVFSEGVWRPATPSCDLVACLAPLQHLTSLLQAGWIRIQYALDRLDSARLICRIYVLPADVGRRYVDRQNKKLASVLEDFLTWPSLDTSPDSWDARHCIPRGFDPWATGDDRSLYYIFNTLPSPSPKPGCVKEPYAREALEDLLSSDVTGLKTTLYPYQRRSAGIMLQRESASRLELDPRLERRIAPDGSTYYFSARDGTFLRHPRYYEACRGGILAETMGLGKTLILLALIVATKNHPPRMPSPYDLPRSHPRVASLAEMAISVINRTSLPWPVEFERVRQASGAELIGCAKRLRANPPTYDIPQEPQRWNRGTTRPPPKRMVLAATTLIVVPGNLFRQWQAEIMKHVDDRALRVLYMAENKQTLPSPEEIRTYDVILFSRTRFELEARDGSDTSGRRMATTQLLCRCPYIGASRTRDCHCLTLDDLYHSPLKRLHFKRLIIDEGHFFSNKDNRATHVADRLITADHRWVVSGTPAKDLFGVEVDMASSSATAGVPSPADASDHDDDHGHGRHALLERRRAFSPRDDTMGAIKSLGALASHFLRIRPWAAGEGEERADWESYIYRHEDTRRRTNTAFSNCLTRTLAAMVVKTQPDDVERDIELPPLRHDIVRLEPSFYDCITANLFTLVLTANAVTSERTDADYLFHKNSQKARIQLVNNLRQSAFCWTGFSEDDVRASIETSQKYLDKPNASCSPADRILLTKMLGHAMATLECAGWRALSRTHEVGLVIDHWPDHSATHWTFDHINGASLSCIMTGASQLLAAQAFVHSRADLADPGEGLSGAGIRALSLHRAVKNTAGEDDDRPNRSILMAIGVPLSSIDGEPLKRRASNGASPRSPVKTSRPTNTTATTRTDTLTTPSPPRKRPPPPVVTGDALPADSIFRRSRIVGTTSAKLSYLLSQIIRLHKEEKILVFYEGENIAYYIAQALDVLGIAHEIYARSLTTQLKAEYAVRFDRDEEGGGRVLLMDVHQAAFGLNLSSASRIYFVNPVCRPQIEAQAIKRAHRIGQSRPVHVETLVLRGSLEEQMWERSRRMTRAEHHDARALEDDGGIRDIIQNARPLPLDQVALGVYRGPQTRMAALDMPQPVWGRGGVAVVMKEEVGSDSVRRKKRRKN